MSHPLFHVKRGHPTPEELAALTTVLAARVRAATAARSRHHAGPPAWAAPAAAHRHPLPAPGPGSWKRAIVATPGATRVEAGGAVGRGVARRVGRWRYWDA
jgi:Acyl-CoA carboxylase epsilon subunit